uniref:Uncharacterized protein n=1 Tax=Romanomermis culicivorax TaxID=13658 RepID=A0A915JLT7_ROMCU
MISKNHLNLFKCINNIKGEQNLTEAFVSQIDEGQSVVPKNKEYETIDGRIRNSDQRFLDGLNQNPLENVKSTRNTSERSVPIGWCLMSQAEVRFQSSSLMYVFPAAMLTGLG